MRKKVNFEIGKPPSQYSAWFSQILSVASRKKNFKDWLYCHNINFILEDEYIDLSHIEAGIFFKDIPECVSIKTIPRDIISACWGNLLEVIKFAISLNYSIIIDVDPYYLPCFKKFHKKHGNNSILIYGYDKKRFFFGAFIEYPSNKYRKCKCLYHEMLKALQFDFLKDEKPVWYYKINLVYCNEIKLEFSKDILKFNLWKSLDRINTDCGKDVFEELQKILVCKGRLDYWTINSLIFYNRLMLARYLYLKKKKYVKSNSKLEHTIILALIISYFVKIENAIHLTDKHVKRTSNLLCTLEKKETEIISAMYNML